MSVNVDDIIQILQNSHLKDGDWKGAADLIIHDSLEKLREDTEELLEKAKGSIGSIQYASLNKMLAICQLKIGKELLAICHLIESHAVILRQQILHRCAKRDIRESVTNTQQPYGLKSSYVDFNINDQNRVATLKARLLDLPEEWYVIQITAQHNAQNVFDCSKPISSEMHELHITVLPTGREDVEPLCVTLPKPKLQSYDICDEIHQILSGNRSVLEGTYANNELYWKMRERQNIKMKAATQALEYSWLREWRILFMADLIDQDDLVEDIKKMIDKLIADYKSHKKITTRLKWLLKKIALSACFLTREEIARAVKYVLKNHEKLANNVILSIYGKLPVMQDLQNATRKTLVLIIDEHMDYMPFESMEILKSHPITRFPSLHIAYALYKEHESTIENGCKIIKVRDDMGTCIVNPSGNLLKMEKRMRLFIEYWLPNWRSCYNVEPHNIFEDALLNDDILMYNGHGNGMQYLPGEQIEKLRVKPIVLLFGCSSVKLLSVGGRYPPYGISNQYLIASSPCVLGMLWEITDADIDKMTASFISTWIPSPLNRPWSDIDISKWCAGTLKFLKNSQKSAEKISMESEMLRAVAKSKNACSQYMTAAAIVVRGLPIKLI